MPVREYHHAYRVPGVQWWKPLLLLVSAVVIWFGVQIVVTGVAMAANVLSGRQTTDEVLSGQLVMTPWLFLANNLGLAALIPIGMLLQWAFTGQRPGFLSSVRGRLRWGWLFRAALVITPIWVLWLVGWQLLAPETARPASDVVLLLVFTVLTTPLQAAGEEYGFRGTVNRCVAAWFPHAKVALVAGAVVSSLLFMAAHLAQDPWLLAYYFGLGMMFCLYTWRTGGLESSIVLHTVNNVVSFVMTILLGGMDQVFERGAGTGSPVLLLSLVVAAVVAVGLEYLARRTGLISTGRPGIEEAVRPAPSDTELSGRTRRLPDVR